MRKTIKSPGEKVVKDIKRATRKLYSSEEKIRIVLDSLRGEDSIAELCRQNASRLINVRFQEAALQRLITTAMSALQDLERLALAALSASTATIMRSGSFGSVSATK